jgi:hypothetical protein
LFVLVLLLGGLERPALATSFVFQLDDLSDIVTFRLLENGSVHSSVDQGGESLLQENVAFISQTTTASVNLEANIFEALPGGIQGPLSDTFSVTQNGGSNPFIVTFLSDTEGGSALTPLVGAGVQTIIENGQYQSVGSITFANGDTLDSQFRSDVDSAAVPEPASVGLIAIGVVGLMRRASRRPPPIR